MATRVYFNTSALNRPLDALSSERVRLEWRSWRLSRTACFRWLNSGPAEVDIRDYH